MENVVVETILLVPELNALASVVIHGVRNMNKVLEELAGNAFVRRILPGEFERDGKHVQAVHSHPARTVGLLKVAAGRQRSGAVEHADVVETKESALKDIHA